MTKKTWRTKIKKACEQAGTYRAQFDSVIDTLSEILEKRDEAGELYKATGSKPVVKHTNKAGASNLTINPMLSVWEKMNASALAYWRDLGLTPAGAMADFKKQYKDADHEFAYLVDSQGYVHSYREGQAHSVTVPAKPHTKNMTLLHNHPSGGAFSKADMLTTAYRPDIKGIVASGKSYDYVFTKGTHFKRERFKNAINNATATGKDYDEAVHNWLTKNQKKYGYKYHRTPNT